MAKKLLFITLSLFWLSPLVAMEFKAVWYKMPPGSHHLNPALFLSKDLFLKLQTDGFVEGTSAKISHGNKSMEMRVYSSLRYGATFSTNHSIGSKLGFKSGENSFTITPLPLMARTLPFRPLHPYIEKYPGDTNLWPSFALGAPHGDCDWFTGDVAKKFNELSNIPAIASYGCRFPYRGVWFDCNRPLMKDPAFLGGIRGIGVDPTRSWRYSSEQVYQTYQDSIFQLTKRHRLTFFTSLHGHDLTVYLPSGQTVSKDVIEGIGIGFNRDQLREIKQFYKRQIRKYFKNPPPLYFGNLPEDQHFKIHGKKVYFLYSAAGTRLYGSLRSDLIHYGLHLETPNSLRTTRSKQLRLAKFLRDLYKFIKEMNLTTNEIQEYSTPVSPLSRSKKFIPSGSFLMGSSAPNAWSNEKPQHQIYVKEYYIDQYEVTNQQFATFLNNALHKKLIFIKNGIVYDSKKRQNIICKVKSAAPMAQIIFAKKFKAIPGRENHPVIYVSYNGAKKFADFYREALPTEAQWEKAASWDPKLQKKFKYGTHLNRIINLANIEDSQDPFENSLVGTTPVGFFKTPSYYGVEDMSGNVWEWTQDYYQEDIYQHREQNITYNPTGPSKGTMHTLRGGSWNFEYSAARTTMRLSAAANFTAINIGFRCVKNTNQIFSSSHK